jgi:hypothetical protein
MNGTSHIVADAMPKIAAVKPASDYRVFVVWSGGSRARRADVVDLSPLVLSMKFYSTLRKDRRLFESVHLIDDGEALAWGDDNAIDMPATSVERLAEDCMTAADFKAFMVRHKFTQVSLAAELGYSRRQINYFLSGDQPIPRVCVLACKEIDSRRLGAPVVSVVTGALSSEEP